MRAARNRKRPFPTNTIRAPAASLAEVPGRKELLAEQRQTKIRSRPWIIGGALLLIALLAFPIYAFIATFTLPPREIAVRVEDSIYTRGDVVDFIRFRQRLTEEVGGQFELGTSLFEALQVIQDNEIAFKLAPQLGITVSPDEVDLEVEFLLQMSPRTRQSAKLTNIRRVWPSESVSSLTTSASQKMCTGSSCVRKCSRTRCEPRLRQTWRVSGRTSACMKSDWRRPVTRTFSGS